VSARDDGVVGSTWATARPPTVSPKAAVAASAARTQARRLTAVARSRAVVTRPAVDWATMASLRSRSDPIACPASPGPWMTRQGTSRGAEVNGPRTGAPSGSGRPPSRWPGGSTELT
jgi:hypothetical protein